MGSRFKSILDELLFRRTSEKGIARDDNLLPRPVMVELLLCILTGKCHAEPWLE